MTGFRRAAVVTFTMAAVVALRAEGWLDLGVPESEVKVQAVRSALTGAVPDVGMKAFKMATPAARVALVQKAVAWSRMFTQSPAFKAEYGTARASLKPEPPRQAAPAQEQAKKARDEFEKNVVEMRKSAAGQSKEIRDMIETTITEMRAQLDAMAKPDQAAMMDAGAAQAYADEQARYKEALQTFEHDHPAAPASAIATQLHHFLDVCGTVDFDAKLVPIPKSDGKMKFADAKYEQQSSEWKMCFRAGREPVTQARTLVQAWLKELGK